MKSSQVTLSPLAEAVPREDLVAGMTVHSKQMLTPTPEEVYAVASSGMTMTGICGYFSMNVDTLKKNFPRTIAKAKSDKAFELLQRLANKTQDELTKGDTGAIKILLNRLNPEDKEPTVVIQQQFNVSEKLTHTTIDDLNSLLIA